MTSVSPAKLRVAWHEAGHAIAALACGFDLTTCYVRTEPGRHGRTEHGWSEADEARLRVGEPATLLRLALVACGGLAGEWMLSTKLGYTWDPNEGARRDKDRATSMLQRLRAPDLRQAVHDCAAALVLLAANERRARHLHPIVSRLVSHGELDSAMMDALNGSKVVIPRHELDAVCSHIMHGSRVAGT